MSSIGLSVANLHILLIEDHADFAANICDYLEARGSVVDVAGEGVTGLRLAITNDYDVVILDLMLPGMSGLKVSEKLRSEAGKQTPILMLTARDTLADKLAGFASGTDDYLVKPVDLPELEVRIRALALRGPGHRSPHLQIGELIFDTETLRVERAGQPILLNHSARQLLELLMRAYPKPVSRERLEEVLWGHSPPDSDSLRSHIYMLRKALDRPFAYPMIATVNRYGYQLVATIA
jgi:DNA-binding response OmpR family regulator